MKEKKIILKKENIVKYSIFLLALILMPTMAFMIGKENTTKNEVNTTKDIISTSTDALSTKKIEWGIKRNDNHEQPDLGKQNKEVLESNEGIAMGNSQKKYLYLTFDEGYEAGYSEQLLKTLKDNEVTATFFITAHYLNSAEELVGKMIENGNIVGNHTVNHKSMPSLSEDQIKKEVMDLHQAVLEKFNYEMKYIRPPMGEFSQKSIAVTNSLGYKTVMWSFGYKDWVETEQPDEQQSKERIINNLHNGEIILLHGNSKTNTNILDQVIKEAKAQGYEFKSLDEFEK